MFVLGLLKRCFGVFFSKKDIVIITRSRTKTLHLTVIMQVVLFTVLGTIFCRFAYNYNRYRHYHNYGLILQENDSLKEEQDVLRKQLIENDRVFEKINEYLFVLNKKNGTFNKSEKTNAFSIKEILNRIDEHKMYIYSFLEARKNYISDFFNKLGFSGINYNKNSKSAKVSNDLNVDVTVKGDSVGGLDEPVQVVKFAKKKPLLIISDKRINNNNFLKEINKMIVLQKVMNVLPLGLPTDSDYRITSSYGFREDPISTNKVLSVHRGIDMVVSSKNIVATMDGTVVFAGFKNGYGNCIDIEHKTDNSMPSIITHYAHLDKMFVSRGQFVSKGEKIGTQGNTGRSTGPHLHYEVRYNNIPINPSKFIIKDIKDN